MQQGTSDGSGPSEAEQQQATPRHPLRALTSGLLDSDKRGKTAWVEKLVERVVDERLRQLIPCDKTPSFATSSFGMNSISSSVSDSRSGFASLKSLLAARALGLESQAAPAAPAPAQQSNTAITRLEHQVDFLQRELTALQDSFFTCTDACNMLRHRMEEVDVVRSEWMGLMAKLQEVQDELRDLKMESTLSKFHFKAKHQEVQDELRSLRLHGTPRSDGSDRPCVDWDQVDKTMMLTAVKTNRSESPRVECVRVDPERIEAELKAVDVRWDQCKCHINFPEGGDTEHKQPRTSPRAGNSEEPTSSDSTITLFSCTTICVTTPME